ncbi:mycofactocin biosynthesis chaperone MftB [Actinomadura sp. NBRC 104412]|uniref:mycofactocin biosynthesis chaperone MftB n=1 Tax=Actinomadura sp. NBRC 104412 TaxID=3032203 RepID=UPI002557BCEC|nr:mycofactocin biosynthesis chaperone MftB [Actinomadura sp. NBRC 104412]
MAPVMSGFDLDRAWDLHPQVSVRPEPFGALLYHFGTRKLSFLKDRRLLEVLRSLGDAPTARAACAEAGVPASDLDAFGAALGALVRSSMIVERTP